MRHDVIKNKRMKQKSVVAAVLMAVVLVFAACNARESVGSKAKFEVNEKDGIWVFIKIKENLRRDSGEYYYYGKINERIIQKVQVGDEVTGLFMLSDMRFINDSDKLELYEDNAMAGSRIFRARDIVDIELQKDDPVCTYKKEELAENALKLLKKKK